MNLPEGEIENQVFKKETWIDVDLKHRVFSRTVFESCDFTRSNFTSAKFLECKMVSCNLSLVKLDGCRLQEIEFENCKFVGVNFGRCEPKFLHMKFKGCLIDTGNFSDLDLKGTLFCDCIIRETYFTNSNLSGADFSRSDLKGSTFHNSDLTKANFREAKNYAINPLVNKIQKARFSKPEVLGLLYPMDIIIED